MSTAVRRTYIEERLVAMAQRTIDAAAANGYELKLVDVVPELGRAVVAQSNWYPGCEGNRAERVVAYNAANDALGIDV